MPDCLAERVGFEPTVRENRTPDFESGPFDHSGTSPLFCFVLDAGVLRAPVKLTRPLWQFSPKRALTPFCWVWVVGGDIGKQRGACQVRKVIISVP